jgi:coproporphyrinogen III oxidase
LILTLVVCSSIFQPTSAQLFGQNIALSDSKSSEPEISAYGNNVYIVWREETTGNGDIYFRKRSNYGIDFTPIAGLSENAGISSQPKIASVGNYVYIAWRDETTGKGDIYFKKSDDNGSSFEKRKYISKSNGSSSEPQISAVGNNVYIVWRDETTGNGDIYFRASDDSGDHFRNIKNLGTTKESSSEPQITTVGNNVYIAWRDETTGDGNIYFRRSSNYGNIFDEIEKLSNVNASSSEPQMSTYQNNLYLIWTQSTFNNMKIFFESSRNLGSDFYNSVDLSRNLTSSYYPRLETSQGNIYVVWKDGNNLDDTHIYFKRISEEYRPNT